MPIFTGQNSALPRASSAPHGIGIGAAALRMQPSPVRNVQNRAVASNVKNVTNAAQQAMGNNSAAGLNPGTPGSANGPVGMSPAALKLASLLLPRVNALLTPAKTATMLPKMPPKPVPQAPLKLAQAGLPGMDPSQTGAPVAGQTGQPVDPTQAGVPTDPSQMMPAGAPAGVPANPPQNMQAGAPVPPGQPMQASDPSQVMQAGVPGQPSQPGADAPVDPSQVEALGELLHAEDQQGDAGDLSYDKIVTSALNPNTRIWISKAAGDWMQTMSDASMKQKLMSMPGHQRAGNNPNTWIGWERGPRANGGIAAPQPPRPVAMGAHPAMGANAPKIAAAFMPKRMASLIAAHGENAGKQLYQQEVDADRAAIAINNNEVGFLENKLKAATPPAVSPGMAAARSMASQPRFPNDPYLGGIERDTQEAHQRVAIAQNPTGLRVNPANPGMTPEQVRAFGGRYQSAIPQANTADDPADIRRRLARARSIVANRPRSNPVVPQLPGNRAPGQAMPTPTAMSGNFSSQKNADDAAGNPFGGGTTAGQAASRWFDRRVAGISDATAGIRNAGKAMGTAGSLFAHNLRDAYIPPSPARPALAQAAKPVRPAPAAQPVPQPLPGGGLAKASADVPAAGQQVYVMLPPRKKNRKNAPGTGLFRTGLGIAGLGAGAYGLGRFAIPGDSRKALEDFAAAPKDPGFETMPAQARLDGYTELGGAAMRAKVLGLPVSTIFQNLRNLPSFIPEKYTFAGGRPDHYYAFARGPLSAKLQMYQEAVPQGWVGPVTHTLMPPQQLSKKVNDIHLGWAKTMFGNDVEEIDRLSPEQQVAVRNAVRGMNYAVAPNYKGVPGHEITPLTPEERKTIDTADNTLGDWTKGPWAGYAGPVDATLGVLDKLKRYGGYAAAGGLGLAGLAYLYRKRAQKRRRAQEEQQPVLATLMPSPVQAMPKAAADWSKAIGLLTKAWGNPAVRTGIGATAGLAGSELENRTVLKDLDPAYKHLNWLLGATSGGMATNKGTRAAAIAGWVPKSLALRGINDVSRTGKAINDFTAQQKPIADTSLNAAKTNFNTAQTQLRNAEQSGGRNAAWMALAGAGALSIPASVALHNWMTAKKKPAAGPRVAGVAAGAAKPRPTRLTLKKPGDYRIVVDEQGNMQDAGEQLPKAAAAVDVARRIGLYPGPAGQPPTPQQPGAPQKPAAAPAPGQPSQMKTAAGWGSIFSGLAKGVGKFLPTASRVAGTAAKAAPEAVQVTRRMLPSTMPAVINAAEAAAPQALSLGGRAAQLGKGLLKSPTNWAMGGINAGLTYATDDRAWNDPGRISAAAGQGALGFMPITRTTATGATAGGLIGRGLDATGMTSNATQYGQIIGGTIGGVSSLGHGMQRVLAPNMANSGRLAGTAASAIAGTAGLLNGRIGNTAHGITAGINAGQNLWTIGKNVAIDKLTGGTYGGMQTLSGYEDGLNAVESVLSGNNDPQALAQVQHLQKMYGATSAQDLHAKLQAGYTQQAAKHPLTYAAYNAKQIWETNNKLTAYRSGDIEASKALAAEANANGVSLPNYVAYLEKQQTAQIEHTTNVFRSSPAMKPINTAIETVVQQYGDQYVAKKFQSLGIDGNLISSLGSMLSQGTNAISSFMQPLAGFADSIFSMFGMGDWAAKQSPMAKIMMAFGSLAAVGGGIFGSTGVAVLGGVAALFGLLSGFGQPQQSTTNMPPSNAQQPVTQ